MLEILDLKKAYRFAFGKENLSKVVIFAIILFIFSFISNLLGFGIGYMVGLIAIPIIINITSSIYNLLVSLCDYFVQEFYAYRVRHNIQNNIEMAPEISENFRKEVKETLFIFIIRVVYNLPFLFLYFVISFIFLTTTFNISNNAGLSYNFSKSYLTNIMISLIVYLGLILIISLISWLVRIYIQLPAIYNVQKEYNLADGFKFNEILKIAKNGVKDITKYLLSVIISGMFIFFIVFFTSLIIIVIILIIGFLTNVVSFIGTILVTICLLVICIISIPLLLLIQYIISALNIFYYPHLQGQLFKLLHEKNL